MTKERPIAFSAPMVRALRDGTKTQTRRFVKHVITGPNPPGSTFDWHHPKTNVWVGAHGGQFEFGGTNAALLCPYGQPGDRLWVREAWAHDAARLEQCRASHEDAIGSGSYGPYYRATEAAPDTLHWRPSIHMPRWASRITLEIVSVRVERLQDISRGDAMGEGCPFPNMEQGDDPRQWYADLWEQINDPGSWAANPWVWVIEFKRVTS